MNHKYLIILETIGRSIVSLGVGHSLDSFDKGLFFTFTMATILLFWVLFPMGKFVLQKGDEK